MIQFMKDGIVRTSRQVANHHITFTVTRVLNLEVADSVRFASTALSVSRMTPTASLALLNSLLMVVRLISRPSLSKPPKPPSSHP